MSRFGLIGTITYDVITHEAGGRFEGLGGILFQAAVLCGLEREVSLYTNLGQELSSKVEKTTQNWATLCKQGINLVPGPGNRVFLHYPQKGERVEILKSVVPSMTPDQVIKDLPNLDFLVLVLNSGFDIKYADWQRIKDQVKCPIWLDVHSLSLEKKLKAPRKYVSIPDWKKWTRGVHYLQVNKAEVAAILGHPEKAPTEKELLCFGEMAFELGIRAAFVTLGAEGTMVMDRKRAKRISVSEQKFMADTTGCGDIFCAGAVVKLCGGSDPFEASQFGMRLASAAVSISGISATFELARNFGVRLLKFV